MIDHVALVTGGAKRIGATIAKRLAKEGCAVVIHCHHSRAEADAVASAIAHDGGRAAVVTADLVNPEHVAALVGQAADAFGPISLLVNNASMFVSDTLATFDVLTWNRQFSVNIRAPSVLAREMAAQLPEDREGAIINIIDHRVQKLTPQHYSYTLSKAALAAATVTMAQSLAPRIRVNGVGPGPVVPNPHDGVDGFLQEAAGTPLGRTVDPEAIADAVVYLAKARHVTGQMISVDSGQHIGWRTPDIVD